MESIWNTLTTDSITLLFKWCTNFFYAALLLIIGFWLARLIKKPLRRRLQKMMEDDTNVVFLVNSVDFLIKGILIIMAASVLGLQTASFIAVLGSIGLAIGLALQGSLSNFAGGILLIIFKPFKKGDFVTIKGIEGFVHKVDLLYTSLITRLNRMVVIPNSAITSDVIINHSYEDIVRRRFYLGISHDSDVKKAKALFYEAVDNTPHILKNPKPFVEVSDLTDNAVVFRMFIWCKPEDYFRVKEPAIENIKYAWDDNDIKMPYPHQFIHIHDKAREPYDYGSTNQHTT